MRENEPLCFELGPYQYREARSDDELRAVHRLNYETFVREIPQHASSDGRTLVDKFDHKNRYLVALRRGTVVGMMAVHDEPPFSAAEKLPDPRVIEPYTASCLEVRLLAVERGLRGGMIFAGLGYLLYRLARDGGYRYLLISGAEERVRFYEEMGFRAIGPAVQEGGARFVPMVLAVAEFPRRIVEDSVLVRQRFERGASRRGDA